MRFSLLFFLTVCFFSVFAQDAYRDSLKKVRQYDAIGEWDAEGFAVVKREGSADFFDSKGNRLNQKPYKAITAMSSGYFRVLDNDKWGLIDSTGKEVIPSIYSDISLFEDTYLLATKDEKVGILSLQNQIIVPIEYQNISRIREGNEDSDYEYETRYKSNNSYDLFSNKSYNNSLNSFYAEGEDKWESKVAYWALENTENIQIANQEGKKLFSIPLKRELYLKWGWIMGVFFDNDSSQEVHTAYYNASGKCVIPETHQYESINLLTPDYFKVLKNKKWGLLDKEGKEVLPIEFSNIEWAGENCVRISEESNIVDSAALAIMQSELEYRKSQTVNTDGISSAACETKEIEIPYLELEKLVRLSDKIVLFDVKNTDNYQSGAIKGFHEGLIALRQGELWGFKDINNKWIIEPKYDAVSFFKNGKAIVQQKGKYGIINREGKGTPIIYKEITCNSFGECLCSRPTRKEKLTQYYSRSEIKKMNADPNYRPKRKRGLGLGKLLREMFIEHTLYDTHFAKIDKYKSFLTIEQVFNDEKRTIMKHRYKIKGELYRVENAKQVLIPHRINNAIPNGFIVEKHKFNWKRFKKTFNKSEDIYYGITDLQGKEIVPLKYQEIVYNNGYISLQDTGVAGNIIFMDSHFQVVNPKTLNVLYNLENVKGRVGYKDKNGKEIIPFKYRDYVNGSELKYYIYTGPFTLEGNTTWGLIQKEGKEILPVEYESISHFRDSLYRIEKYKEVQIVNKKLQAVFPKFENLYFQSMDSIYLASQNNKFAILNRDLAGLTPFVYDNFSNIEGIKYIVVSKNQQKGILTKDGKEILPCKYGKISVLDAYQNIESILGDYNHYSSEKLIVAKPDNSPKLEVFTPSFKPISLGEYTKLGHYAPPLLSVQNDKGKFGAIDTTGKVIIPFTFKKDMLPRISNEISDDYYSIHKGLSTAYYDKNGKRVTPFKWFIARKYRPLDNGLFAIRKKNKTQIRSKEGEILRIYEGKLPSFLSLRPNNSFFYLRIDTLMVFLPHSGIISNPTKYENIADLVPNSYYSVKKEGKFGVIDSTGKEIIAPKYDELWREEEYGVPLDDSYFKVKMGKYSNFLDIKGKELFPFQYDEVSNLIEGMCVVSQDSKVGCVDKNNQIIQPLIWSGIRVLNKDLLAVNQDCKWKIVRKNGEMIYKDELDLVENRFDYILLSKGTESGLMDSMGNILLPTEYNFDLPNYYDYYNEQARNTLTIRKNELIGLYDLKNRKIIAPCMYSNISNYISSRETADYQNHSYSDYTPYSSSDNQIMEAERKMIQDSIAAAAAATQAYIDFGYGLQGKEDKSRVYLLEKDEKYGLMNNEGNILFPVEYDEIYSEDEMLLIDSEETQIIKTYVLIKDKAETHIQWKEDKWVEVKK